MPSFLSTPSAIAGSPAPAASSIRASIISFTKSVLPSLPVSFYDYVPFILAGLMALLFTALLVLLVEDSEDTVYPHSPRLASADSKRAHIANKSQKGRIVAFGDSAGKRGSDDEEFVDAWDPRADLDSTSNGRNLKQSQDWIRAQNQKRASSRSQQPYGYPATPRRLLASPPASASPQASEFAPPILSMVKIIMHRHDQFTKRSRSSSRPSPPPSPPSTSASGSFGHMQYTLKSASLKVDKIAIVAFPAESVSPPRSPSPPSSSATTQQSTPSTSPSEDADLESASSSRNKPTRHARSRSMSLSISLPSLSPALQILQKQPSPERTIRRRPSSELEEGRSSPEPITEGQDSPSRSRSPSPKEERSLLSQLEEGAQVLSR